MAGTILLIIFEFSLLPCLEAGHDVTFGERHVGTESGFVGIERRYEFYATDVTT